MCLSLLCFVQILVKMIADNIENTHSAIQHSKSLKLMMFTTLIVISLLSNIQNDTSQFSSPLMTFFVHGTNNELRHRVFEFNTLSFPFENPQHGQLRSKKETTLQVCMCIIPRIQRCNTRDERPEQLSDRRRPRLCIHFDQHDSFQAVDNSNKTHWCTHFLT